VLEHFEVIAFYQQVLTGGVGGFGVVCGVGFKQGADILVCQQSCIGLAQPVEAVTFFGECHAAGLNNLLQLGGNKTSMLIKAIRKVFFQQRKLLAVGCWLLAVGLPYQFSTFSFFKF
jgi:hypothetical protein